MWLLADFASASLMLLVSMFWEKRSNEDCKKSKDKSIFIVEVLMLNVSILIIIGAIFATEYVGLV